MTRWNRIVILMIMLCMFSLTLVQGAEASTTGSRLAGDDRYLTAIAVSQSGWPQGSATAVLTTGENYPDALSAAPLAGKYNAPILLVSPSGISPEVASELKRLNTKKVYIVGGTGVIPHSVESKLTMLGISSVRLAGPERYDTALEVAKAVGTSKGIFVVSGENFADALSVAPIAAAEGMPILLVPYDNLTQKEKSFFAKSKLKRTILVGGDAEISDNIRNQFPGHERINGSDAYERNIALIRYFEDTLNLDTFYMATGEDFPDALSAAALARQDKNALVLVKGNEIPSPTRDYLAERVVGHIIILGGNGVISSATESELTALTAQISEVENMTVNVLEKQAFGLPKTVSVKTNIGNWEEVPVTWNLDSISTEKAGTYYYTGSVEGYDGTVELTLIVEPLASNVEKLNAEVIKGGYYTLPEKVQVKMSDNSYQEFPVTWSSTPTVSILGKVGTYSFQGTVDGTKLKANCTLKVSEDEAIQIGDSRLKWAVKRALDRQSSTQPVYLSDVLNITSLDVSGYGIEDLKGLERFTNLQTLDLSNNGLTGKGLTSLSNLTHLKSIDLKNNDLKDVSSLKGLTSLTYLDISNNGILDFSPLKDLTQLKTLYLRGNSCYDYSPTRSYYKQLLERDFIYGS